MDLYPYQIAGRDYLASRKRAMLADDMGLGKTIQAIAALYKVKGFPALVVCPASLTLNWKRELEKYYYVSVRMISDGIDINNYSGPISPETQEIIDKFKDVELISTGPEVTICSYNMLGKVQGYFNTIIADESHYLKSHSSLRTKRFFKLAEKAERVWFLTGTPITSTVVDCHTQFRFIAPDVFPYTFRVFAERYTYPRETPWGYDYSISRNLDELHDLGKKHVFLRRLKSEVLRELPEKIYSKIYFVPEAQVLKHLERLAKDIDIEALETNEHIASIRRELAQMKVNAVRDYALEVLEEKKKIVMLGIHVQPLEDLTASLRGSGLCVAKLTGSSNVRQRQEAIDSFQDPDGARVFVGNIQAAGVGITLTAADTIIFLERSWVPAENIQAEDRIHRIGQRNVCQIIDCVVPDSIDEAVLGVLLRKQKTIREAIDGKEEEGERRSGSNSRHSDGGSQRTVSLPDIGVQAQDADELPWWFSSQ